MRQCEWDRNSKPCPNISTYYDAQGDGQTCIGHTMMLTEPKYHDPVSPRMARELKRMLTDPDEAPEIEE